ncbi:MAG: phosphoribosylanthranilate isomerase [Lachnospiraceae bacterium]|nr:phosphoribosylanthranilate isomerase [Lachnospiraceae bacterium]
MAKIKICGLFRECDIDYVNEAKPDHIGFILNFPKSHRNITPEFAKHLKERLNPGIKAVGVFVNQEIDQVVHAASLIGLDVIQLHGAEDDEYIEELRKRISLYEQDKGDSLNSTNDQKSGVERKSQIEIWKAFKIQSHEDLKKAENSAADEILLDNGYGTGKVFDWSIAAGFERDFFLAGGLNPDNIKEAIRTLKPKLVDISSGVETERLKDREKIIAAVRAVREASEGN